MRSNYLFLTAASLPLASSQHVSTYTNPAVPTGTPIPGNYTGILRPQVHFSPPQKFMNDPNGMFVDANGTWHLYYQYNPTDVVAGNQHWGHATSEDLYHWLNQPIALFPPEQNTFVFSGSAVIDVNNTSGFFPGQDNGVVAIFTLAPYGEDGEQLPETQGIAYSLDGGFSFQYYDGNPILDVNDANFRDPKAFWYEDHWVMAIAYARAFTIGFYISSNLKDWTHASNFSHPYPTDTQYECPNLVKLPVRDAVGGDVVDEAWVLAISINPGAPLGGSATEYYAGTFNGTHFGAFEDVAPWTDFAKDNYAAQYFYGLPDGSNAVNIGWASNWQYCQSVPTGDQEGWRSSMTLPRISYLINTTDSGWVMVDDVYNLAPVLDQPLNITTWRADGSLSVDYASIESNAIYLDVNVTGLAASVSSGPSTLNISFTSPVSGEALLAGFDFGGDNTFYVDRGNLHGFNNSDFTAKFSVQNTWNSTSGSWRLQLVFDRTLFEVFLDNALHVGTVSFFPLEPLTGLTFTTQGLNSGSEVTVAVWSLKSAWKPYEDASGLVVGNVTETKAKRWDNL